MTNGLGKFEETVVNAIFHLHDNAYGLAIHARVAELTGRPVAVGAIYTTLNRLEKKKVIESHMGDPTPKRGGRRKRYYTMTTAGLELMLAATLRVKRLYPGLVS